MSALDISNESNKSIQDLSPTGGIIAKLRRMKIQEDLIIQNIKKNFCEGENDFIKYDLEFKKYVMMLKTSFADMKQLFDDIKCVTKSPDTLQKSDIDDVKKDVIELDEKIKTFKNILQKELVTLKATEQSIAKQDEVENRDIVIKRPSKILTKSYSDIIPSPVRNIINSPFKYPEVQQFQDFLSQSHKYGGWNEYNHNIFVKLWQKHFQCDDEYFSAETLDHTAKNMFINEVFENVFGVKRVDIIPHIDWYAKYLMLKKQQQIAIKKWRAKTKPKKALQFLEKSLNDKEKTSVKTLNVRSLSSKTPAKCGKRVRHRSYDSDDDLNFPSASANQNCESLMNCDDEFLQEMEKDLNITMADEVCKGHYAKPTKQWNNRCKGSSDVTFNYNNIDNITKLGIPTWRSKL